PIYNFPMSPLDTTHPTSTNSALPAVRAPAFPSLPAWETTLALPVFAAFLPLWEFLARTGIVSPLFFPPPPRSAAPPLPPAPPAPPAPHLPTRACPGPPHDIAARHSGPRLSGFLPRRRSGSHLGRVDGLFALCPPFYRSVHFCHASASQNRTPSSHHAHPGH